MTEKSIFFLQQHSVELIQCDSHSSSAAAKLGKGKDLDDYPFRRRESHGCLFCRLDENDPGVDIENNYVKVPSFWQRVL